MRNQKKLLLAGGVLTAFFILLAVFIIPTAIINTFHEQEIAVKSGDTLSSILLPQDLSASDIHEISKLLRKEAKVNGIKADCDTIKLVRTAQDEPIVKVVIKTGPWRNIEFSKHESGWECNPVDVQKDTQLVLREGVINDGDSFYTSGIRAGIPETILANAYDLLAFEIDFERDMREGQQFSILYEENHAEGRLVDTGSIVALVFDAGNRGIIKMYRFVKSDGRVGYYDEQGGGAIKSLKRTPINNARVTSSFSGNRKHPVLGFTRAHRGVDFRAGYGLPIPSAGAGRVVKRGSDNGYGNFIRIRHNATFETLYAHMSRFAPGVGVGTNVKQGQIVGYVGSTGISTGPHLHYEIIRHGVKVNPMTVKLPAIDSLGSADKNDFLEMRSKLDKSMEFMKLNSSLVIYQ